MSDQVINMSSNIATGICKSICTREGLLVNNVVVNTKSLLAVWFERLTDIYWSENTIFSLLSPDPSTAMIQRINALSPKDMQDVPRALKLLSLTADLRNLDTSDSNPSERNTYCALSLLGETLEALVAPFTNPDLTISQQTTSLVMFSHLIYTLFLIQKQENLGKKNNQKDFREKIAITIDNEEYRLKIPENNQGWATAIYTNAHKLRHLNRLPSIHDERPGEILREDPGHKKPLTNTRMCFTDLLVVSFIFISS